MFYQILCYGFLIGFIIELWLSTLGFILTIGEFFKLQNQKIPITSLFRIRLGRITIIMIVNLLLLTPAYFIFKSL